MKLRTSDSYISFIPRQGRGFTELGPTEGETILCCVQVGSDILTQRGTILKLLFVFNERIVITMQIKEELLQELVCFCYKKNKKPDYL